MRRDLTDTRRPRTATPAALGLLTAAGVLALVQPAGPAGTGLTATFLVVAPAAAVALPLRTLDPLARVVVAVASVLVLDTLVAQTMLAADAWSIRTGVLGVGVLSALLVFVLSAWLAPPARAHADVVQHERSAETA